MSEPEQIIYTRHYSIWVGDAAGGGKWEEHNTPAEAGRRIEELLLAGKGREHNSLSVSVTEKPAQ